MSASAAQEEMSKRVLEAQSGYDQARTRLKSLVLSPGGALAVASLAAGLYTRLQWQVLAAGLYKLWGGDGPLAVLVASLSANIFVMMRGCSWTTLLDDGLSAAARHLTEAVYMERELSKVVQKLQVVHAALDKLHEAVQKQAEEGRTMPEEVLNPAQEGRRLADGNVFAEFTLQMDQCANDQITWQETVDEMRKTGVDELSNLEARLGKRTDSADDLLRQLRRWEDNSWTVKKKMAVLMNSTYGAKIDELGWH